MIIKNQKSWLAAISLMLPLMFGCSTKSVKNDYAFTDKTNEGIVILSVSHDLSGGDRTRAIFYLDKEIRPVHIMIKSLDQNALGFANESDFSDSFGQLLVLTLPAGNHTINSWQIASGTGLRIGPKAVPAPLSFNVAAREVRYLGNLHANIATGKNLFGTTIVGNGFPEVRDMKQRDIPLFESRYPQLKDKVKVDLLPLGAWVTGAETQGNVDLNVMPINK